MKIVVFHSYVSLPAGMKVGELVNITYIDLFNV